MARKLFLSVLCAFMCSFVYAQSAIDNIEEPEFIGESVILTKDSSVISLDKQVATVKSSVNVGLAMIGVAKGTTRIEVAGAESSLRLKADDVLRIIIRAADNESDPMTIVSLYKFDIKKKNRRANIASYQTFKGASVGNENAVSFSAKKFKEASYIVSPAALEPGEYGIFVTNANATNSQNIVVGTFGIDE